VSSSTCIPIFLFVKGSLLLPCSKMPIGIFLFSLKSEFQKSEENGGKRRKPEKISGFSVGIFFVNTCWGVLTKKMPLVFPFAKTLSSAIRTLCNASAVKMYCNINLIPFRLEFGFTFRAYVCLGYHNHIQNDKQDNYGNGYKIPWNIKVTAKPINLTGWEHKS